MLTLDVISVSHVISKIPKIPTFASKKKTRRTRKGMKDKGILDIQKIMYVTLISDQLSCKKVVHVRVWRTICQLLTYTNGSNNKKD